MGKFATVEDFIEMLKKEPIVKKNLYKYTWTSGSSTTVKPIMIWQDTVELQWDSNRKPEKWIEKMVAKGEGLVKYGYFSKSDGSCPSSIAFKLLKPNW